MLACMVLGVTASAKTTPTPVPAPPGVSPFVPKGPKAERHIALERKALALINSATGHVFRARRACRPTTPRPLPGTTHDVPAQATLDAVAALRRPAVPGDTFPARPGMVFGETYVDYTRSLTSASGKSFYLVVARFTPSVYQPSASCLDAEHAQLVKLLRGKPRTLRSAALGEFGRIRRGQEQTPAAPTGPRDGLFLFSKGPGGKGLGGGGGGGTIADFRKYGLFTSSGRDASSTLTGLVPDGVASVTLQYPRTVSRGRWYKPAVYPSAIERTVPVQQNVLSVRVPRGAPDAFPPRMVWRAADGTVVHVATRPGY